MLKEIAKQIKIICNNEIEENAIINTLLARIVSIAGLKNINFDSNLNLFGANPLSHYALNFIPSGGNKGNTIKAIDNLFSFISSDIDVINKNIKEKYIEEELECLSANDQKRYRKKIERDAEKQEQLMACIDDATPEGLYDSAELINKLQKGFIFIKNTEFANYFTTAANDGKSINALFLNVLYDLWDGLYTAARKIKGKTRKEQNNITCSAIFMSAFRRMSNSNTFRVFKENLSVGNARRFLFFYNPKIDYILNPPEEPTEKDLEDARTQLANLQNTLKDNYNAIKPNTTLFIESNTVKILKTWYKQFCFPREQELRRKSESINNEILSLYLHHSKWTIAKLLVVIHLINKPTKQFINDDYLKDAIDFWEESYKSLENIILFKNPTVIDTIINCFIDNVDKVLCRKEIMQICDLDHNYFKQVFDDSLPDVIAELEKQKYNLTITKGKGRTQNYMCSPMKQAPDTLNLSYSTDMTEHYKYTEITTDEFIDLIKCGCNFVAGELKNGYRKAENYLGGQNTIWLDFDDGTSIEEAKELFNSYWYVIYTTRNHQKEKSNKQPCDRFRVILRTEKPLPNNPDKAKNIMTNIIKAYNTDGNCKDASRFYYGNAKAEIYTNKGGYFNWSEYDIEETQEQIKISPVNKKTYIGDSNNKRVLCDENLYTDAGEKVLQTNSIGAGNRDCGMQRAIGILIEAVSLGDVSHNAAIQWVDDVLERITDKDFEKQAKKFRDKIRELKI